MKEAGTTELFQTATVFVASMVFLIGVNMFYSSAPHGEVFIGISSESLMQTFSASVLRERPFASIYFNHIQPPLFDSLRAVIASFWSDGDIPLPRFVDMGLYGIYVALFGVLSALLFAWISRVTGSKIWAWISIFLWTIHPGPISMAAFLDGTFLNTILITWMIFELWLISENRGSVSRLVLVASMCFFARSHFQWFFVPVLGASLILLGVDRRRLIFGMAAFLLVVCLYCVKQYVLFGTASSYGFQGDQLAGLFWIEEVHELSPVSANYRDICAGGSMNDEVACKEFFRERFPSDLLDLGRQYPKGALAVSSKYNTEDRWWLSHIHKRILKRYCSENPGYCLKSLWRSVKQNFPEYWVESWQRGNPVTKDREGVPWLSAYERVSRNFPWFVGAAIIIFGITVLASWRRFPSPSTQDLTNLARIIGMAIVPGYVFSITLVGSVYDGFEGGRLRFLLEPTLFVFVVTQGYFGIKHLFLGARSN